METKAGADSQDIVTFQCKSVIMSILITCGTIYLSHKERSVHLGVGESLNQN